MVKNFLKDYKLKKSSIFDIKIRKKYVFNFIIFFALFFLFITFYIAYSPVEEAKELLGGLEVPPPNNNYDLSID